jgi:hypothetical protein
MRGFYTTLECWTNQFEAFELLANLRTSEDELFIVRNGGDLVTQPNIMQQRLPEVFELRPRIPFNCFFEEIKNSILIKKELGHLNALNGLRALDNSSVYKWTRNSENP